MSSSITNRGAISEVEVRETRPLQAILEELGINPKDYIVLVNDSKAKLDQIISPRDRVLILPKVRGGAH